MSAPTASARWNAYIVFDGNSSSPPWWAMFSGVCFSHGFVAAEAPAGSGERDHRGDEGKRDAGHTRNLCDAVLDRPQALDLEAHHVAGREELRRVHRHPDTRGRAGEDQVAGRERDRLAR